MKTVTSGAHHAVGVAQADPNSQDSLAVISALATSEHIAGFRLPLLHSSDRWLNDHGAGYWQVAETHRQVVSLLIPPALLDAVDQAATLHPGITLLIEHLARLDLSPDRPADLARLCRLARHKNVHVKVSVLALLTTDGWPYREAWADVFAVLEAFGPNRVVWGSDYPFVLAFGTYEQSIAALEHALDKFDPTVVSRVFRRNSLDLYFSTSAETK
jgi:L-fuconolactonase